MYKYKMIMKKILSALGIIVICLCSCNNNITNPEVDEPKNETKTETPNTNSTLDNEKSNCLLNISPISYYQRLSSVEYLVLNSLTIKDENGKVVGTGAYWGSYYVPYDGTLTINWKHRDAYTDFVTSEYTFNVKSAHQLDVVVYNVEDYCSIIVGADILYGDDSAGIAGGSVIASFDH
jgi:hypothetical protein